MELRHIRAFAGAALGVGEAVLNRPNHRIGGGLLTQVLQQHLGSPDRGNRIWRSPGRRSGGAQRRESSANPGRGMNSASARFSVAWRAGAPATATQLLRYSVLAA